MIWTPGRNSEQGLLVAEMYHRADAVPCERRAVVIGGLRGADKSGPLAHAGVDRSRYLTISIDAIIEEMAARGLIPVVEGLSPLEGAELVHAEAQFLAKRLGLRALADGRNLIWDITMACTHVVESWLYAFRRADYTATVMFVEISIEEAVRRSDAGYRRGREEYRRARGYGGRFVRPEAIRALAEKPAGRTEHRGTGAAANCSPATAADGGPPAAASLQREVTGVITSYLSGQLTLDELALEFRTRRWPTAPACPAGQEAAATAIDDPEPYIPGSFDDVVLAYDLGRLSDPEYESLAVAAAT